MTTRDTPFTAGTPCRVDLFTGDGPKSKACCSEPFGGTVVEGGAEPSGYSTVAGDGRGPGDAGR